MKTVAGMLVVLGMMLTACGPMSNEDPVAGETATISEGSVNPDGSSSVGSEDASQTREATDISLPTCGCGQDGCCSEVCYRDPDCGVCVVGRSCYSNGQCGGTLTGRCNAVTKKCSCLIL
ncbi:hypothetical protein JY651_27650 [Pyxidicoccus parkwayensis]|uniref:Lipoprotein n=1 Tax=Pyxidicoccus parkwayensis TaxID=2813578 RepID=A0ABX7NJT6_9BACT|nr:hypothetical protein [Pyxidicoccus parkwaysis]QSQ19122.1 hypothetical protein JY651_27650 [Pyxidicoccus parkwaysis]